MSWKGKNVLVTGIAGLIGSNLARRLVSEGARVVGLVRDTNFERQSELVALPSVTLYRGDVTDYRLMCEIISSNEIEVVFHLAAYSIVRISANDPYNAYNVNVMGTVALLEACRNVGRVKSIVCASSDKAYGEHEDLPYKETHALIPRNTYDTSKACMDMISRTYAANYKMPVIVTRCSNVYGPGDANLSRLVPNTIRRVFDGDVPMLYSDIENMEREFIYVDDVVDGYMALAFRPSAFGEAFNIGGTGVQSIRGMVTKICEIMGKPGLEPEIVPRDRAFREINRQYIDASKMLEWYGWSPRFSLDEGLRHTVDWYTSVFSMGRQ